VEASVLPGTHGNLTIANADIANLLTAGDRGDVVILDVDNGPEPLVTAANARLYSTGGLRSLRAHKGRGLRSAVRSVPS
jgi:hypothetical protein